MIITAIKNGFHAAKKNYKIILICYSIGMLMLIPLLLILNLPVDSYISLLNMTDETQNLIKTWAPNHMVRIGFAGLIFSIISLIVYSVQLSYASESIKGNNPEVNDAPNLSLGILPQLTLAITMSILILILYVLIPLATLGIFSLVKGLGSNIGKAGSMISNIFYVLFTIIYLGFGLWLFIKLSLWFAALAMDKLSGLNALKKSINTSKGNWFRILGLLVCTSLLSIIIEFLAHLPFRIINNFLNSNFIAYIDYLLVAAISSFITFFTLASLCSIYKEIESQPE